MKTNCPECQRQQNCNPDIYNGKCKNMRNDNIRLAQHRLYRGFILPSITEAMGETNGNYVHEFILKPEYIDRKTGRRELWFASFNDMPERYQTSGRTFPLDNGYGHIPSMKTFTIKETMDYLRFCENLLYVEIGGKMKEEDEGEKYQDVRGRVFK